MDIFKIALYLSGKLPPKYNKPNPGAFVRRIGIVFPDYVQPSQLTFIQNQSHQSEDLYFQILDDIYKDNKIGGQLDELKKILKEIGVPDELLSINLYGNYTWLDFNKKIEALYGNSPSNQQKGELFEKLSFDILAIVGDFINVHRSAIGPDGGIDIIAIKEIKLGKNTQINIGFFGQCKYKTSGTVQDTEINKLLSTINNDVSNKYQGVFFFTNQDYSANAMASLNNINNGNTNRVCFWLNGNDILDIINSNSDLRTKYSV